jgi:hypothetical protein
MEPAVGALGGVGAPVARALGVGVGAMVGTTVAGAIKVGVAHAVKPIALTSKVSRIKWRI